MTFVRAVKYSYYHIVTRRRHLLFTNSVTRSVSQPVAADRYDKRNNSFYFVHVFNFVIVIVTVKFIELKCLTASFNTYIVCFVASFFLLCFILHSCVVSKRAFTICAFASCNPGDLSSKYRFHNLCINISISISFRFPFYN